MFLGRKAVVIFSYKAEEEDELTLEVGDIINNIVDTEDGWCKGELNGRRGMFPENFVERTASSDNHSDSGRKISGWLLVGILFLMVQSPYFFAPQEEQKKLRYAYMTTVYV